MEENEKLEIKNIAGYLPYKLNTNHGVLSMINIDHEGQILETKSWNNCQIYNKVCDLKPILRPMSDLTKEIKSNKNFLPIRIILDILNIDGYNGLYTSYEIDGDNIKAYIWGEHVLTMTHSLSIIYQKETYKNVILFDMYNRIIELLNEYHFDYNGLIKKGLAIDINTF